MEPFVLLQEDGNIRHLVPEIRSQIGASAVIEDAYPCTPLQEGLLALSMKEQGKFMPQLIFTLPAGLDMTKFKGAWQVTANSNAPLRTMFVHTRVAGLIQAVHGPEPIEWIVSDDLADYLMRDRALTVSFGCKLSRYAIVDDMISASVYFVWTVHHAVIDGFSMELFLKRVEDRYRGVQPRDLVQFDKFISYIMKMDKADVHRFWEKELADTTTEPFPKLPSITYSPRPEQSLTRDIRIPDMVGQIATPSTMIQGAWALLIQRYTASEEAVFGIVLAGRNVAVENVCGLLIQCISAYLLAFSQSSPALLPYSSDIAPILTWWLDRSKV